MKTAPSLQFVNRPAVQPVETAQLVFASQILGPALVLDLSRLTVALGSRQWLDLWQQCCKDNICVMSVKIRYIVPRGKPMIPRPYCREHFSLAQNNCVKKTCNTYYLI